MMANIKYNEIYTIIYIYNIRLNLIKKSLICKLKKKKESVIVKKH